jgi:hypothetical protein
MKRHKPFNLGDYQRIVILKAHPPIAPPPSEERMVEIGRQSERDMLTDAYRQADELRRAREREVR